MNSKFKAEFQKRTIIEFPVYLMLTYPDHVNHPYQLGTVKARSTEEAHADIARLLRDAAQEIENWANSESEFVTVEEIETGYGQQA